MFGNLYKILSESHEGDTFCYDIEFDPLHSIYQAHFPGNPVTPGACQLEVMRQLVSEALGMEVSILNVKSLKFLEVINPLKTPVVSVELDMTGDGDEGKIKCAARISTEDTVYTKAVIYLG
ncbi:MAG: hypothetical protein ACI4TM_05435 [Candidatus Cryptobacteroides sp.]